MECIMYTNVCRILWWGHELTVKHWTFLLNNFILKGTRVLCKPFHTYVKALVVLRCNVLWAINLEIIRIRCSHLLCEGITIHQSTSTWFELFVCFRWVCKFALSVGEHGTTHHVGVITSNVTGQYTQYVIMFFLCEEENQLIGCLLCFRRTFRSNSLPWYAALQVVNDQSLGSRSRAPYGGPIIYLGTIHLRRRKQLGVG